MVASTCHQIQVLLRKNFLIVWKTKEFLKMLIFPLITYFILQIAHNKHSLAWSYIALFYVPLSLVSVTRYSMFSLVEEKSTKQKEIQKIMGMRQSSYVIGWFITNSLKFGLCALLFLVLVIPTDVMFVRLPYKEIIGTATNTQIIIGYILFGTASMSLSYFLSVFFAVPKTAGDVSVLVTLIGTFLAQLLNLDYVKTHKWVIVLMNIFPSTCFTRIIFDGLSDPSQQTIQFSIQGSLYTLLFETIFYFLLYLYLDVVLPNEYGSHKHPLFFIKWFCKKSSVVHESYELPLQNEFDISNEEDNSSAFYHEKTQYSGGIKSIEISQLSKTFGDVKAVEQISLSVYESQLLCLLGHNGAGKTTTISLVTGLVKKDSGIVKYYGRSIDDDLDEIRQTTGICVQKDVLYDDLTVIEHLEYFGRIKGFQGYELQQEIQYILNRCVLVTEQNKLAKQLSGGNKRKLSLGMALIGKSKVVFLDEPTSGMDPVTRRSIWSILEEVKKEQRTLILTTHHLDEAEYLSERIAIMAKGHLLTLGSADFIKKNFGIGYHLNVYRKRGEEINSIEWASKKQSIISYLEQQLPKSQYNPQTAEDQITYLVPFQEKGNLVEIFKKLEEDIHLQVDLAMTSLEEAFINIGIDEEKFIKKTKILSQGKAQIQEETSQSDYNDFSNITIPECLHKEPSYTFQNQFYACFLRKVYNMKVGKKLFIQIIVPLYFSIVAVLVCYLNKPKNPNEENPNNYIFICAFGVTFELSFGMCIAGGNIAGQPVQEREQKLKYSLNVMGCRVWPYWIATMVFDYLVGAVIMIAMVITLAVLDIGPLVKVGPIFIFFAMQFAFVGLAYSVSWLYRSSNMAFKTAFLLLFGYFVILPLILLVLIQKTWFFYFSAFFSPVIAMVQGLTVETNDDNFSIAFTKHYVPYIIILICQGFFGLFLCVYIDKQNLRAAPGQQINYEQVQEEDVLSETARVPQCNDNVRVQKLAKVYANGFVAVRGTSFGIDKGQVFGLLGPNGAGKSTTFNMITSRLKPTSGNVYLKNQIANKGNAELYQQVGICPQFDCLWDVMNPVEHLTVFAMLKGLKGYEITESVEYFIKIMSLDAFRKTQAEKLSGGNKRKLCVSIALIGSPCMQFFDEPSSGVDPISRRFLWNTIQQGLKINQSAVVLTTHSMDEAESLCHKIGIQVNGRFVCMGSPQHLKAKYGQGYQITIDLNDMGAQQNVLERVKNQFPNCIVLESKNEKQKSFQFPNQNFSFYKTFDYFQNYLLNKAGLISDFSIIQSSLENVFLYFAGFQQIRPENEVFQPKKLGLFHACMANDEDD